MKSKHVLRKHCIKCPLLAPLALAGRTCLLILVLRLAAAAGEEYSLEGNLSVWVSGATPAEAPMTGAFDFYAQIRDESFKIRMKEPGSTTNYNEYSFSRGTMYVLHNRRPTEIFAEGNFRKVAPGESVPYYASVASREIPPAEPWRPQFVWFAYLSSRYFQNISNSLALPIWSPEDPAMQRQPFPMFVYFRVSDAPPHLPTAVDFINDGYYRSYSVRTKTVDVVRLRPPFDLGFTNAIYRVLETTNSGNLVLPASWVFQVYSSPLNAGEIPTPRLVVRGKTYRISDSAPEETVPKFTGLASVADWRQPGPAIQHGKKVELPYTSYPITNSAWLNASAARRPYVVA